MANHSPLAGHGTSVGLVSGPRTVTMDCPSRREMTISQWQDAMETNVPGRVLWQLQTLSTIGESEVLSLSKLMSMMNNNSQSRPTAQADVPVIAPTIEYTDIVAASGRKAATASCRSPVFTPGESADDRGAARVSAADQRTDRTASVRPWAWAWFASRRSCRTPSTMRCMTTRSCWTARFRANAAAVCVADNGSAETMRYRGRSGYLQPERSRSTA